MFITLVTVIIAYSLVENVRKDSLSIYRFWILIYVVMVLIFALVSYVLSTSTTKDSIGKTWESLSKFSKDYYKNDISNLIN